MALQDSFNTGDDNSWGMDASADWSAQTFQASSNYDISSVILKLLRSGSPGNITVSLYGVDVGTGKPDISGGVLATGTTDGDTLTTSSSGEWREITFGAAYSVVSGTDYAIVTHCATADVLNLFRWRYNSSGGYSNGQDWLSANSGSTWGSLNADFMFETYNSSVVYDDVSGSISGVGSLAGIVGLKQVVEIAGTIAGVGFLSGLLEIDTYLSLSGTISGTGSLSGSLAPSTGPRRLTRRVVAVGGNTIFYET